MNKRISILKPLIILVSIGAISTYTNNVHAASKLTINKVYEGSTKISGKTYKKNEVKIKIGKKTYHGTAKKNGKFIIKVPKLKSGKKYTLKSYKKKKLYAKKKIVVLKKEKHIKPNTPTNINNITYKNTVNPVKFDDRSIAGTTNPNYSVQIIDPVFKTKGEYVKDIDKKGNWKWEPKFRKNGGMQDTEYTINFYNYDRKLIETLKVKAYDKKMGKYTMIEESTWHCRTCGQLLVYAYSDEDYKHTPGYLPFSKTMMTLDQHFDAPGNHCAGSWFEESYIEGRCYYCGDKVAYGQDEVDNAWKKTYNYAYDHIVDIPTRKGEYKTTIDGRGYYNTCRCGENLIMIDQDGKGIYLQDL